MKITSLDNAAYTINNLKRQGKSVVMCHGVFDLLHLGHIKYFEKAKRFGDFLMVTITPDKFASKAPGRPLFNEQQRAETIEAISCVDMVSISDYPTAVEAILKLKPDFFAKGGEYSTLSDERVLGEMDAVHSIGGKIEFTNEITFSSSKLINYITYPKEVTDFIETLKEEYGSKVLDYIEDLRKLRVLVIGEAVLDRYIYGDTIGKSNKSPSLVFKTDYVNENLGVPFNVANHLSTFCDKVKLVTTGGNISYESHFLNSNVSVQHHGDNVITKTRYVDTYSHSKVFEVYEFEDGFSGEWQLARDIGNEISKYDITIVCDSGHGMLTPNVRSVIKSGAVYLAVNTQMNAGNVGSHSIRKYWDRKDNTYICVNEREFRLATHEHWDDYTDLDTLLQSDDFFNGLVAITRGPNGCKIADWEGNISNVPAFTQNVVDPVGAGDAFLAITALLAYNGVPIDIIGFIGNAMGALATMYEDNKEYITKDRLITYIKTLMR